MGDRILKTCVSSKYLGLLLVCVSDAVGDRSNAWQDFGVDPISAIMAMEREIDEAKGLANWIAGEVDGLDLPGGRRAHLAGACLSVALDHHSGIIALIEDRHHPSAVALIRPLFEAYIRGSWLAFVATDEQVEAFAKGKEPPRLAEMIEGLERQDRFNVGVLSQVKQQTWGRMCDFTHTGALQVAQNMTESTVERAYVDDELEDVLGAANGWALLVSISLAGIAQDEPLSLRLLDRARCLARVEDPAEQQA